MAYDKSRKWLLTINNPLDNNLDHTALQQICDSIKGLNYYAMCDEVGEKGTYHIHLFLYRVNPIRFDRVKKLFPTAHIDYCRGTIQENRDYLLKEGKYAESCKSETSIKGSFYESSACPTEHQGKRSDLEQLYRLIKDGMSDYEILEIDPTYMNKLETIERTRQIIKFKEFSEKLRELDVVYRYGKSGTGKSKTIIDKYGFKNVYRVTDNKHPFDSYAGEDVIVFEEFYSSNWRINDMLNYLDIYPFKLPCRYNNKQACYTKVYINSNIPLSAQYTSIQKEFKDTWQAFCRRISCVQYFDGNSIKDYKNIDEYLREGDFVELDKFDQQELLFD